MNLEKRKGREHFRTCTQQKNNLQLQVRCAVQKMPMMIHSQKLLLKIFQKEKVIIFRTRKRKNFDWEDELYSA